MNAARLRSLHGYGAIASFAAIAAAVLAYLVQGSEAGLGVMLGLFGCLGGFYFAGAYLSYFASYRVVGEELMRGVVWYGGSLLGWSILVTETSLVAASPFVLVGLPALTAAGCTGTLIAVRRSSDVDPIVRSERGRLLATVAGTLLGSALVGYLVLVGQQPPLLLPAYAVASIVGIILARRSGWIDGAAS